MHCYAENQRGEEGKGGEGGDVGGRERVKEEGVLGIKQIIRNYPRMRSNRIHRLKAIHPLFDEDLLGMYTF